MGSRGILRQPGSVRAEREGGVTHDAPETITAPGWLLSHVQDEFLRLVADLTDANVPIKEIDSYAIAMTAFCICAAIEWIGKENAAETLKDQIECSNQITRYQRDSQKWLDMIGATPASRARLGLKGKEKKTGTVANLLAMRKNAEQ